MKETASPWFVWLVGQFGQVINGIQSNNHRDLILYNKAGILWTIRNAKGYTPLLYFVEALATKKTYTKQHFENHLKALSFISKKQIERGFTDSAIQLLKEGNFLLLKTLFTHFDSFEQFFPDEYIPKHLQGLFTQMIKGVCQFNHLKQDHAVSGPDPDRQVRKECLNAVLIWASHSRFSWATTASWVTTEIIQAIHDAWNRRDYEALKILFNHCLHYPVYIGDTYTHFTAEAATHNFTELFLWLVSFKNKELPRESARDCVRKSFVSACAGLPYHITVSQPSTFDCILQHFAQDLDHLTLQAALVATLETDTDASLIFVTNILEYAYKQKLIKPIIQGTDENNTLFTVLKKKRGAYSRIENFLKALAIIYRREYTPVNCLAELDSFKNNDLEMAIFFEVLSKRELELKGKRCLKPLTFTAVKLAGYSLGYYAGGALSSWDSHQHLTVLDLSNNTSFGSANMESYWICRSSWFYSSGLQRLAKSLKNNTALQKLILAMCGVNNRDFSTLVRMLMLNSSLSVLDLSDNKDITAPTIQEELPTLYEHRYTHQFKALRPRLDLINTKKKEAVLIRTAASFNPSPKTFFHQNIRLHIEQSRLHSLGAQIKLKTEPNNHGTVWDQIAHFLHCMVLVSSAAGAVLGVIEIFKTMKLSKASFKHGFHNVEEIIEVFEHLYLGTKGLEILVEIITEIRKKGAALSDKVYYRYNQYGLTETMTHTLVDFIHYLLALFESEHQHDLTEFFQKFDSIAMVLDIDKTAAELSHNFIDYEQCLESPYEVQHLSEAVAHHFNQFCKESHLAINWSCIAQEFSHWILTTKPTCFEIVNFKKKTTLDNQEKEEAADTSHTDIGEESSEWIEDVIRHRGFRCYGNNNEIISFNLRYKKLIEDNKPQAWITTDGDRFGYYPIGQIFLGEILETIQDYKKDNPGTRIIRPKNAHIEYEISEHEIERLSQQTLKPILSGYQPTEEQLRNIQAAISDLKEKVEALRVKTDENTMAIATLTQRVDEHDVRHQDTDKKLKFIAGVQQDNDQVAPGSQEQTSSHVDVVKAQDKRIVALEGEVGALKKENNKQKKTISELETKIDSLSATVVALVGQQGQVVLAADNAAHNANLAAGRAEGQVPPAEDQQQHGNNNQDEGGPENRREIPENPPIEPDNLNATAANPMK